MRRVGSAGGRGVTSFCDLYGGVSGSVLADLWMHTAVMVCSGCGGNGRWLPVGGGILSFRRDGCLMSVAEWTFAT